MQEGRVGGDGGNAPEERTRRGLGFREPIWAQGPCLLRGQVVLFPKLESPGIGPSSVVELQRPSESCPRRSHFPSHFSRSLRGHF